MMRTVARSKLRGLRITQTDLQYEGSLTLGSAPMAAADIVPGERIQVVNLNNGTRLETYVIEGRPDSGECVLNGPAARLGVVGDVVHVISYALVDVGEDTRGLPRSIRVDDRNRPIG